MTIANNSFSSDAVCETIVDGVVQTGVNFRGYIFREFQIMGVLYSVEADDDGYPMNPMHQIGC